MMSNVNQNWHAITLRMSALLSNGLERRSHSGSRRAQTPQRRARLCNYWFDRAPPPQNSTSTSAANALAAAAFAAIGTAHAPLAPVAFLAPCVLHTAAAPLYGDFLRTGAPTLDDHASL